MTRQRIAVISLIIFVQAVMYPAAVFALYVETDQFEFGSKTSLPANFPDNGDAFYFGYSNSEEEQSEQYGLQTDDFNVYQQDDTLVMHSEILPEYCLAARALHLENCTPPPERN